MAFFLEPVKQVRKHLMGSVSAGITDRNALNTVRLE
jgi:hypothetical protein